MSNYCRDCAYSVSKKTGEGACPFNYLYWHFVDTQRKAFEDNGRAGFMVNMYKNKNNEDKNAIRESSEQFLSELERYNDE
jgi:deoxyribodipyrimidine photolyase-related protein